MFNPPPVAPFHFPSRHHPIAPLPDAAHGSWLTLTRSPSPHLLPRQSPLVEPEPPFGFLISLVERAGGTTMPSC